MNVIKNDVDRIKRERSKLNEQKKQVVRICIVFSRSIRQVLVGIVKRKKYLNRIALTKRRTIMSRYVTRWYDKVLPYRRFPSRVSQNCALAKKKDKKYVFFRGFLFFFPRRTNDVSSFSYAKLFS